MLVPTYRRVTDLERCLDALGRQSRPADQVVLVVRDTDQGTWDFLTGYDARKIALCIVSVSEPGTIAAMRRGLAETTGDIVALTDDDSAPRLDWLERLDARFRADDRLGGVGGRDWIHERGTIADGIAARVGLVQWYGRTVGNHHLGSGPARRVDFLKGVNCAYRGQFLRDLGFDPRMRGSGTVMHWEMILGFATQRAGWTLLYDPEIAVDHYIAPRYGENQRYVFDSLAVRNVTHNETLSLLEYFSPPRRLVFMLWALLIGTQVAPGLLQGVRLLLLRRPNTLALLRASLLGRLDGWHTYNDPAGRKAPGDFVNARPGGVRMTLKSIVKSVVFRPGPRPYRLVGGALRGWYLVLDPRVDLQVWRGVYERPLQDWLSRVMRPGMVCLDVGAADGYFVLLMAHLAGPTGRVYAFEPSEKVGQIRLNSELNAPRPLAPVEVYQAFIGAETRPPEWVTGDDLVAVEGLSRLDVVKVDVDGGEMDVLTGMRGALARFHPHLFVEVHSKELHQEVTRFLDDLGYEMDLVMPEAHEHRPLDFNAFLFSKR